MSTRSQGLANGSDSGYPVIGNPGTRMLAIPGLLVMVNTGLLLLAVRDYIWARIGGHHVHRDLELRVNGRLYEITTVNDEVIGSRQGFPAAERGYSKTLESVADCAGRELVDQIAESIK